MILGEGRDGKGEMERERKVIFFQNEEYTLSPQRLQPFWTLSSLTYHKDLKGNICCLKETMLDFGPAQPQTLERDHRLVPETTGGRDPRIPADINDKRAPATYPFELQDN